MRTTKSSTVSLMTEPTLTVLWLSLLSFWVAIQSSTAEGCGGCHVGADEWEVACWRLVRKTNRVYYRGAYHPGYFYERQAPYCCDNYHLDGSTCVKNGCGGDPISLVQQRACVDQVTTTIWQYHTCKQGCARWCIRSCVGTQKRRVYMKNVHYRCSTNFTLVAGYCHCGRMAESEVCGINKYQDAELKIVGGTTAKANEFPWQVYIESDVGVKVYTCGGTIISDRHILTAAHCVSDSPSHRVYVGKHEFYATGPSERRFEVDRIIVHPSYSNETLSSDVALLRLTTAILFSAEVRPACLPTAPYQSYVNHSAVISGWGKTSTWNRTPPAELQYAVVSIAPPLHCQQVYGSRVITPGVLCVTDNAKDYNRSLCDGDSGGPMVIKECDGRWHVVGIASFVSNHGCAVGEPSGYSNVAYYLTWIKTNMI